MEALAEKVQSLEMTRSRFSGRILQIELKTDKIKQKMEKFCPLSDDIGKRKMTTVVRRECDFEETGHIPTMDHVYVRYILLLIILSILKNEDSRKFVKPGEY